MYQNDTIAAIATAMSPSGIGIVRISGADAFSIADRIYRSPKDIKLNTQNTGRLKGAASHTIHYGYIADGDEIVDEVMVLLMKAPNTYTREDTIEIDCHGGVYVMKRILETVIKYGARPAEPGEFTKRAFLNGRIDLSQAESVIDVINSKNEFALQSSISQLKGSVKKDIQGIREKVIHEIAFIESALDDPEHISLEGYPQVLHNIVDKTLIDIHNIVDKSDDGRMLKEGVNTVIVGKPNAGKSSLLNALSGENRAIVTDIAGTTRDVLEEHINIGGMVLNIMDTAGIRSTEDIVEKIGVDKAKSYAQKADLIIYVIDSSTSLDSNDYDIISMIRNKNTIILMNKSDLTQAVTEEEVTELLKDRTAPYKLISVSMTDFSGLDQLEETMKDMFFHGEITFNDQIYITNVRQKTALIEAQQSLEMVIQSIEDGMPEDFFSIDLMAAYESLGKILGESLEDDLVNEIFSKFCMGK